MPNNMTDLEQAEHELTKIEFNIVLPSEQH